MNTNQPQVVNQSGYSTGRIAKWGCLSIIVALAIIVAVGAVTGIGQQLFQDARDASNALYMRFTEDEDTEPQAEQPVAETETEAEQPVAETETEAEQPSTKTETQDELREVAVDWNQGAFGDSLFDHTAQPKLTLLPGHGAIFSADPSDFYLDGAFAFGGKISNQGIVAYVYNDSDKPVEILVDLDYYNSTWRRPDGQHGRWSIHGVVYEGTLEQVRTAAEKLQYAENKPLYFSAYAAPTETKAEDEQPVTETETETEAEQPVTETETEAEQPVAETETEAEQRVCNKLSGTGPAWISSDPATVNGTQVSTRFTLIVATGVQYNISGVPENNMSLVCDPSDDYMKIFDNAPTRVEIGSDGNVNVTTTPNS